MTIEFKFPESLELPTSISVSELKVVFGYRNYGFVEITADSLECRNMHLADEHFKFFNSIVRQLREGLK